MGWQRYRQHLSGCSQKPRRLWPPTCLIQNLGVFSWSLANKFQNNGKQGILQVISYHKILSCNKTKTTALFCYIFCFNNNIFSHNWMAAAIVVYRMAGSKLSLSDAAWWHTSNGETFYSSPSAQTVPVITTMQGNKQLGTVRCRYQTFWLAG